MNKQISVFISSSMSELENEREIVEQALRELNVNPTLFELFPAMSGSPVTAYVREVEQCDVYILILWKLFSKPVQKEFEVAVRANKPILVFRKTLKENEIASEDLKEFFKAQTSFDGMTEVAQRVTFKDFRRLAELSIAVKSSIALELGKFYQEPIFTLSRQEMYELGRSIVKSAQKRLFIVQNSSSLILGARDYMIDEEEKSGYDKEFTDAVNSWIDENKINKNVEFLHLFSLQSTKEEIEKLNLPRTHPFIKKVRSRIERFKEIEKISRGRFRFNALKMPFSGPMIIGDSWYAIWIVGGETAFAISQDSPRFCGTLARILMIQNQLSLDISEILP
jgi:Domain of unknown function (DUF4062)